MGNKDGEKFVAERFLIEFGTPVTELLTLKEFASRDPDPHFNLEHLDSTCPDIVAVTAHGPIGLELTAYSNSELHNALNKNLQVLNDAGCGFTERFPELKGFTIYVSANNENHLQKRNCNALAEQLLEFVAAQHAAFPFSADEERHYPRNNRNANRGSFANLHLLKQHVQSITVHFRVSRQNVPVSLSGGFGTHFGTRLERLKQVIAAKTDCLKNSYTRDLNGIWLLMHATGHPRSSRIAPLRQEEVQPLIRSVARQTAIESGFNRVFLWDGVRGGIVDSVNAEAKLV